MFPLQSSAWNARLLFLSYLNVAMFEQYGFCFTTIHGCHFGSKYNLSYRAQRLAVEHFRTLGLLLFGMAAGGWVLGPTH